MKELFRKNECSAKSVLPVGEFRVAYDLDGDLSIDAKKGEVAVKRAEGYLDKPIPVLRASDFMRYAAEGNRMIFERPYHERRTALVTLSLAEAYERSGRFVKPALDYLYAIFEESTWVIPAHQYHIPATTDGKLPPVFGDGVSHGIDLFAATTGGTLTVAYLCLAKQFDEISPVIRERIRRELRQRIFLPFCQTVFGWSGEFGNRPSNWCPWIVSNVLFATAVLEDSLDRRRAVATRAMKYLDNYTKYLGDDGACDEGPSYWSSAGASYFDCAEILYDMSGGRIDIFGEPLLRNICEYEAKFHIDGVNFINFADCPPQVRNNAVQIKRMGRRLGSSVMLDFAKTVAKHNPVSIEPSHCYRVYRGFLEQTDESDASDGILDVWLPDLKVMVARECPATNEGMLLAVKGGHNGEHHNHNDLGSVVIYYEGRPVIIDNGAGEYTKKTFSSERYTLWYMQSRYHNTLTVNGVMQKDGSRFKTEGEIYDKENRSVTMELRAAYPEEAKIKSLVRSVRLDCGRAVISDRVSLDGEGEIELHFLVIQPPVISGNQIALAEGRTLYFDKRLVPEVETVELDPSLVGRWKSDKLYMIRLKARVTDATLECVIE